MLQAISEQIKHLQISYPGLHIMESNADQVRLHGSIHIYRSANSFTLDKNYNIEILIPLTPGQLPEIIDTGKSIDESFIHRYSNGKLCLETDTAMRIRFIDGLDLLSWMDEFVEPYYFSYEYYQRYGEFPFGERPHACLGTIDTYKDQFHCNDDIQAIKLIAFAVNKTYRGHVSCPCGSGKKLRNCHGQYLFPFMTDERYRKIILDDFNYIKAEFDAYEQTRTNSSKAK